MIAAIAQGPAPIKHYQENAFSVTVRPDTVHNQYHCNSQSCVLLSRKQIEHTNLSTVDREIFAVKNCSPAAKLGQVAKIKRSKI